jgi:hypothetical protein
VITNKYVAEFTEASTAGNAMITASNGGLTGFHHFTNAGSATITTLDFSSTVFVNRSNGGQARFITNGTGVVNFSLTTGQNDDGKLTAGSIEGTVRFADHGRQCGAGIE